jgi:stage II sporulation protein D
VPNPGARAIPNKMRTVAGSVPVLLALLGTLAPATTAAGQESGAIEVVIEGKGWGHGVGLSQEGAYSMAMAGASAEDILGHFYPGTAIGRSSGTVQVNLFDQPPGSVVLRFPSGGEVRAASSQPPGFPVTVSPGGSVRVYLDGGAHAVSLLDGAAASGSQLAAPDPAAPAGAEPAQGPTTTTTVPTLLGLIPLPPGSTSTTAPPPTTAPSAPPPEEEPSSDPRSSAPLVADPSGATLAVGDDGKPYRGTIRVTAAGGGIQLVNDLDVEEYLQGMGEVLDPSWPAAALQAQAIVARTYALDAMRAGRELCSGQQCQVYLGQSAEYSAMSRAVAATRGQVVMYEGRLAEAVYSANAGGISATPEEGFGRPDADHPYLKPVTYPTLNPDPWEFRIGLAQLAARMGYPGEATAVVVARTGPSGRVLEVNFVGDAGSVGVEGRRFAETLGLRSTLFQIRMEGGTPAAGSPGGRRAAAGRARRGGPLVLAAGEADDALGRTPWGALALLLLVGWGTAAVAYRARIGPSSGR